MYSSFTGKSCRQLVAEHAHADEVEREAVRIAEQRRAEEVPTEIPLARP